MQKGNMMSFVKGAGAGMIAGATAVVVGKMMMQDRHNISKGSTKVIKAVGEMVDGVNTIFR
ncbi:MAG: hypothetical protein IKU82_02965 [Clostridia bacterium]|nr:hypothetical protein [Clostridia bacterium]